MSTETSQGMRLSLAVIGILLFLVSCSLFTERKAEELRPVMIDSYQASRELYSYVWSPSVFSDKKNEAKILDLLSRLANNFHEVETLSEAERRDPGFFIALRSQNRLVKDIAQRFKSGQKDYANWRLRGITNNCLVCHSRTEDLTDFIGGGPSVEDHSAEGRLAAAEFLIATRQFEKGLDDLFDLAKGTSRLPSGASIAMKALKLWLTVQVRVKDHEKEAADSLEELVEVSEFSNERISVIRFWINDLRAIESKTLYANLDARLIRAAELLEPVASEPEFGEQEKHLVKTLASSAILHQILEETLIVEERRRALYLLGLAYSKAPIESFSILSTFFLERCIREFPNTDEARKAYSLYRDELEFESSGSGGEHIDEKDQALLIELRHLSLWAPQ